LLLCVSPVGILLRETSYGPARETGGGAYCRASGGISGGSPDGRS
jgi:hypothetical protein